MTRAAAALGALVMLLAPCAAWRRSDAEKAQKAANVTNETQGGRRLEPGPWPNPTAPWWLNDAPLQQDTPPGSMPVEADVVIIGAGMTGASVARHIAQLEPGRAASTLVLDARGAAGGATGRNGGMCVPQTCGQLRTSIDTNGLDEALAERANNFGTMDFLREYVEAYGVEADLRFDGYYTAWRTAGDVASGEIAHETCLGQREQCGDPYCGLSETLSSAEAQERMQSTDVAGALYQSAGGGLWAARIVFALLQEAIDAGVTLRTQTRVVSVDGPAPDGIWTVNTDRGAVRARHVVYATNAYTSSLLPEFEGIINPYRNQVLITEPVPQLWPELFWFSNPPTGASYTYHLQRPDGRIVIGSNAEPGEHLDDSEVSDAVTQRMLGALRELFPALAEVQAEQVWMGVTQWTADGFPWVGPLPSQPGNYIAAGFVEGMVECFSSGHAIAQMLAGNDDPQPFNPRYLPSARAKHSH